jgi:hypothetical protein
MNEPTDPINVRQARQGKPVLVILAVSLFLAGYRRLGSLGRRCRRR